MATDALNRPIRGIDTGNIALHHQPWDQETFQHIQVPGPSLESSQTGRILAVSPGTFGSSFGQIPLPPLTRIGFPWYGKEDGGREF